MKREQWLLQKGLNISLTTKNCSVVCWFFFFEKTKTKKLSILYKTKKDRSLQCRTIIFLSSTQIMRWISQTNRYKHQRQVNVIGEPFVSSIGNVPTQILLTLSTNNRDRQREYQRKWERDNKDSSGLGKQNQGEQERKPLGQTFTILMLCGLLLWAAEEMGCSRVIIQSTKQLSPVFHFNSPPGRNSFL